jgi:hypothetical protein
MHDAGASITPLRDPDPLVVALREIDIAIQLVVSGRARVVELVGLEAAELVAGQGLAQAQAAGIGFELHRSNSATGAVSLRIGPALAR